MVSVQISLQLIYGYFWKNESILIVSYILANSKTCLKSKEVRVAEEGAKKKAAKKKSLFLLNVMATIQSSLTRRSHLTSNEVILEKKEWTKQKTFNSEKLKKHCFHSWPTT